MAIDEALAAIEAGKVALAPGAQADAVEKAAADTAAKDGDDGDMEDASKGGDAVLGSTARSEVTIASYRAADSFLAAISTSAILVTPSSLSVGALSVGGSGAAPPTGTSPRS